MKYTQVEGNKNLYRDEESTAIINKDSTGLHKAKLVKSRQDDKVVSLEYRSYKEDQDNFKLQNDRLKVIDDFVSPYVFDWNQSNQISDSIYNDDMKEKRDRWIESLEKDIYVNEAMNLLKDLLTVQGSQILSQANTD